MKHTAIAIGILLSLLSIITPAHAALLNTPAPLPGAPLVVGGCALRTNQNAAQTIGSTATNLIYTAAASRLGSLGMLSAVIGNLTPALGNAVGRSVTHTTLDVGYELTTTKPVAWLQLRAKFGDGSFRVVRITNPPAAFTPSSTGFDHPAGNATCAPDVVMFTDGTAWVNPAQ